MKPVVIGNATLYLGDCREVLPGLAVHDLLLTDPPYGIGESSRRNATRGKPFGSRVDAKNTRGTYVPPTDYGSYEWDESPPEPELIDACTSRKPHCFSRPLTSIDIRRFTLFEGDPAHLPDWRADGLEVYEVCNVVPVWVQRLGLTRPWCRVQDAWRWLRLW